MAQRTKTIENASKLIRIAKSLAAAFADFEREQALNDARRTLAYLEFEQLKRRRNNAAILLMEMM